MSFQQGLSGLNASSRNLGVIGHNIANANTIGMKASRSEFSEVYASSAGVVGGVNVGLGVEVGSVSQEFSQGNLTLTGNDLDIAINGSGFYQLTSTDGTTAYTRDGSFHIDSQGALVTSSGFHVQPAITIPANALSVTIARDGTISVMKSGSATPTTAGQLQLVNFVNPAGLQSMGENMLLETA